MAILPVYTTSKLHAARINLKHLAQQTTPGVSFNYVKGVVFGRKWAWFSKIFEGAQARPTLRTPLHEILDPPLALQLHISNNARVSTPLSRIRRAHDLCSRIMSEASERIKAKVLFVYYIFPLQLRMAMYQYESAYFPTPYADNQLLSVA